MQTMIDKTVREIALESPATTRVFEEFKIDYCCGGRKSLDEACAAAGIDPKMLAERLNKVISDRGTDQGTGDPERLSPSALIDHIISTHHIFTSQELSRLGPIMQKVVMRHGENHPELLQLESVFSALADSLIPHMRKEENILFPHILMMDTCRRQGLPAQPAHFGTVKNPIGMMMLEHDTDGDRLREMREITDNYKLPEGACPTYTALFAGLQDLERDLHRHIHLENNVLFPAAAELEAGV